MMRPGAGSAVESAPAMRQPTGVPGKTTRVAGLGAALPAPLRERLEASLGTDLSAVRVREDASVAAIGARAYAQGTELAFAPGAYQPDSERGQELIAHEVVHLVQQASGRVAPTDRAGGLEVNADRALEREADELGARALRGERLPSLSLEPRPSDAPIQGFFDDLSKLVDPFVDAAAALWGTISKPFTGGGEEGKRKGAGGGGEKGKGGGKGKGKGGGEIADLPKTDDAWQETIAGARAGVTLTEDYAVDSMVVNPDLLYEIRSTKLDAKDPFYDVLVGKADRAPTNLSYRLTNALVGRVKAQVVMPQLLAQKLALIDKHAPSGTMDLKKSTAGGLRVGLEKDLSKARRQEIHAWFHARYEKNRLTLDAGEVAELRALIEQAVAEHASDPKRDAAIEALRAEIAAVEQEVRAKLRAREAAAKRPSDKALWSALVAIADADGVFVSRAFRGLTIQHEDGSATELESWTQARSTHHFLNPGGFHAGGGKYDDATVDDVLGGVYGGDEAKAATAKKFIHTLNRNEGGPASMNTWDSEIVTAGPGLAGSGRLQKSLFAFKEADPAGFHDALGKFGIDIVKAGGKGNAYFTVRVPVDASAIPAQLRGKVTPGEVIVGSTRTGAKKSSASYEECAALRYIQHDPILLSRFMYAGEHAYQRFLLEEAVDSMHQAETFVFTTGAGRRIDWTDVVGPLGGEWLGATQAVIAYRAHASSEIFRDLHGKVASHYATAFGDRAPAELTEAERKAIARFVTSQLKTSKYKPYRAEFPAVADELFPL